MDKRQLVATWMAIVLVLIAAACGDDSGAVAQSGDRPETTTAPSDSEGSDGEDGTFPVTIETDSGEVTIEARPEAIVSLSPTGTEMLFAIGAGDQVVAVDDYSYFPPEAPVTDLSGFQPNLEAIAGYEPDLVVLNTDPGDIVDGLDRLGIPAVHLDGAADLDEVYSQIERLGAATDHVGEAAELVSEMQIEVDEIVAGLPDDLAGGTYYHELDTGLYSVTSDTFIGQMYGLLGLSSIADAAEGAAGSGGYLQLNAEFILDADPDFVFLADAQCCGESRETVAARPGWDVLSAVQGDRVIAVDEDVASRWGPRIVDLLRDVADAVTERAAQRS